MSRYTVAELRHMRIKQIVDDKSTTDVQKSHLITLARKDKKATLAKHLGMSASKAKRRSAKAVKRGSRSPRKPRSPNAYAKFVRAYSHKHKGDPELFKHAAAQWNSGKRTVSPAKKRKTPTKKTSTKKRKSSPKRK